jgi:hypothetical protein
VIKTLLPPAQAAAPAPQIEVVPPPELEPQTP